MGRQSLPDEGGVAIFRVPFEEQAFRGAEPLSKTHRADVVGNFHTAFLRKQPRLYPTVRGTTLKLSAATTDSVQKYHVQQFCGLHRAHFNPRELLLGDAS
jgi:hypothetical protein